MSTLSLLHFNDAYTLRHRDFDVSHFAGTVDKLREQWPKDNDGKASGLFLFSGDIFNPSVESIFTRGEHMIPIINELRIDAACPGNHDFDFGAPQLAKLIEKSNFPWILSNIVDNNTESSWCPPYWVTQKNGVKIGIIGLVESDWVTTVMNWDPRLEYRSMVGKAIQLSKELRDPQGHAVDLIIALTHSRLPNDIDLAKATFCRTASRDARDDITNQHGIDIILGGHDHFYYVGKGCKSFDDAESPPEGVSISRGPHGDETVHGAEEDDGVLVVKSGTDFRDLSSIKLFLEDAPPGSIRRKLIREVKGQRHWIRPSSPSSTPVRLATDRVLLELNKVLHVPICLSLTPWNVRSEYVRTRESPVGNWVSDCLFTEYQKLLTKAQTTDSHLVDGVLICAGSFRTDMVYPSGIMSAYDIVRILPFDDPIVLIEVSGQALWDALESSLSLYPALEGRFPAISGMKVTWDPSAPPLKRLRTVYFLDSDGTERTANENDTASDDPSVFSSGSGHNLVEACEESAKHGNGIHWSSPRLRVRERLDVNKTYRLVTAEYMAQGYDGFYSLKGCKYIIGEDNGLMMCEVVKRHLTGNNGIKVSDLQASLAKAKKISTFLVNGGGSAPRDLEKLVLDADSQLPIISPSLDGRLEQTNMASV